MATRRAKCLSSSLVVKRTVLALSTVVLLLRKRCILCTAVCYKPLRTNANSCDKQEPEVVFLVGAVHELERSAEDVRRVIEARTLL